MRLLPFGIGLPQSRDEACVAEKPNCRTHRWHWSYPRSRSVLPLVQAGQRLAVPQGFRLSLALAASAEERC